MLKIVSDWVIIIISSSQFIKSIKYIRDFDKLSLIIGSKFVLKMYLFSSVNEAVMIPWLTESLCTTVFQLLPLTSQSILTIE